MTMNATTRYTPGSFVEVDDLHGGRKLVMVGRDGVTFWDSSNTEVSSPLVLHPVFRPTPIGTLVEFVRDKGLLFGLRSTLEYIRSKCPDRMDDSLFSMRAIWFLASKRPADLEPGKMWAVSDDDVVWAVTGAYAQEQRSLRLHEQAQAYYRDRLAA